MRFALQSGVLLRRFLPLEPGHGVMATELSDDKFTRTVPFALVTWGAQPADLEP
jgi:hypothetical protein